MSDFGTTIYYNSNISSREKELVDKYWEIISLEPLKFRYSVKALSIEFSDIFIDTKSLSSYAETLAYVTSAEKKCASCDELFKYVSRPSLQSRCFDLKPRECKSCLTTKAENAFMIQYQKLEEIVDRISIPKSDFHVDKLSYLECIYMLTFLNNKSKDGPVNLSNKITTDKFDNKIIQNLIDKGFLFFSDELNYTGEIQNKVFEISFNLSDMSKFQYENLLQKIPAPGVYIIEPTSSSLSDVHTLITKKLTVIKKLKTAEVRELEIVINNILMYKAIQGLKYAEFELKFSLEKNESLINTLQYLVMKYSSRRVNGLLNFVGEDIALGLSLNKIKYHEQFQVFTKKLNDLISYLQEDSNTKDYFNDLPSSITPSLIEEFTCNYILENVVYWDNLSGEELLNKWMDKPNLKNSPILFLSEEFDD